MEKARVRQLHQGHPVAASDLSAKERVESLERVHESVAQHHY